MVEVELIQLWNTIDKHKEKDLLVKVYNNFMNDIFKRTIWKNIKIAFYFKHYTTYYNCF